ncbi:MAG: hypothetical protein WC107_00480 [Patescibacteria group bacterium]
MKIDKNIVKTNFILNRFQNDKPILIGDDDKEVLLDKSLLPKDAKEGSNLVLTIATEEAENKIQNQKAKDILNEILKA